MHSLRRATMHYHIKLQINKSGFESLSWEMKNEINLLNSKLSATIFYHKYA